MNRIHLAAARCHYEVCVKARTFGFQKTSGQTVASLEAGIGVVLIVEHLTKKAERQ
jgi:hypothetical protein